MSMARFRNLALGLGLSAVVGTFACAQGTTAAAAPAASNPAASAPAPTGPVPTKIGVVNIQQAIQECAEGKKEIDALQSKFSPKQVELKQQNDDIENLKKQYQTQADKLSDDEKSSRAKAIEPSRKPCSATMKMRKLNFSRQSRT